MRPCNTFVLRCSSDPAVVDEISSEAPQSARNPRNPEARGPRSHPSRGKTYEKREWIRYFTFFFEKRQNGIESIFIHVPAWFSSHSTMIGNAFFSTKKGANFRLFMTMIGFVFSLHFGCDRKRKFYC